MQDLINGRCGFVGTDPLYVHYHDTEWGYPTTDDQKLFEFLILESAQAGLSWITILKKRENYKKAFYNFSVEKVAQMSEQDINRLMHFDGIIKNRLKIKYAIQNARCFMEVQKEFGCFYNYIISFFPEKKPIIHHFKSLSQIPTTSLESDKISHDMKKRGFKFFGSTICYSFLQATGFIDDHLEDCLSKKRLSK